eukprot:gene3099-3652_t
MGTGFDRAPKPKVLRELASRLRDTPGDRLLISNEDLCELDAPRIDLLRELDDLCDVTYIEFDEVEELRSGLHRFFGNTALKIQD